MVHNLNTARRDGAAGGDGGRGTHRIKSVVGFANHNRMKRYPAARAWVPSGVSGNRGALKPVLSLPPQTLSESGRRVGMCCSAV